VFLHLIGKNASFKVMKTVGAGLLASMPASKYQFTIMIILSLKAFTLKTSAPDSSNFPFPKFCKVNPG